MRQNLREWLENKTFVHSGDDGPAVIDETANKRESGGTIVCSDSH
jgi:hypothetical protein